MKTYSTNEAAKKVGITGAALSKYIKAKKVPAPASVRIGRVTLHSWTERDIESLRKLLPKIANGRKTRYQKKRSAVSTQPSAKPRATKQKKKKTEKK